MITHVKFVDEDGTVMVAPRKSVFLTAKKEEADEEKAAPVKDVYEYLAIVTTADTDAEYILSQEEFNQLSAKLTQDN
jgi:hypothetical protein